MFTQDEIRRFEARRLAETTAQRQMSAPKEQPKGRSGLLRFLPTALGVGATLAAAPLTGGASLAGTAAILGGAAAAGSGLGELGAQVFGGEKIDTGRIGKEALISGATGAIPIGGAAKAARVARTAGTVAKETGKEVAGQAAKKTLRGRVAGKLEDIGGRMLNSQTNLTRAEIRKIDVNAPKLFTKMQKKYGISNLDEMARIAPKVTGENGIYSEAVRNAIGNSKGIDTGDLKQIFEQSLTAKAPLVTGATKKNLEEQLKNNIQKMYSAQPLNPKANPLDAFDVAKNYRAQAQQLKTGATVSSADKQIASVYDNMANVIEKRLYGAEGVAESLPLLKGEIATKFKQEAAKVGSRTREGKALLRMAKEAENIKTVADLRSIQKPWVLASKVEEGTARAAGNAAARLGGGGGIIARVTNPMLDAATPAVGRAVTNASSMVAGGALPRVGTGLTGRVLREGAKQEIGGAVGGAILPGAPEAPELTQQDVMIADNTMADAGITPDILQEPDQVRQGLQAAALQALAAGDTQGLESITKTVALLESLGMFGAEEAKPKELTSAQQTRAAAAQNALNDIPMIEDAIASGKLGGLKNLPGSGTQWGRRLLGTEDLDAALFNIADNILRARSGAAAPEAEVQRFKNTFLPRESDSENAKRLKLQRAIRELQGYINPQGVATGGVEDSLAVLQEQL